tara:strand:- start:128 stop:1471 length:1344 start_codon:yes stop_codon:yes gene_type:complete
MAKSVSTKASRSAFAKEVTVTSNTKEGVSVDLVNGFFNLTYFESILQDTIHVSYTYSDIGTVGASALGGKNALDGLPIRGSEKVSLKFSDNNGNELDFGEESNNSLYVNDVTPLLDETTKSLTQLHLVSKEYILNEKVRINSRMDGKISQHIQKILTEEKYLNSQKPIHIEQTIGEINESPKNKKPFYVMNELSKKGVSRTMQQEGKSAGYFLFETYDGFNFKSIDGLLDQEPKLKIIYNESSIDNLPQGYDVKALAYSRNNLNNVQKKLAIGAYTTRVLTFNPFTFEFTIGNPQAFMFQEEDAYKTGGETLPKMNEEFNNETSNGDFSVTSLQLEGIGGMQIGDTQTQLSKSKKVDFKTQQILNQSFMRYNNLFVAQLSVTIPGDFSLRAGDAIVVDAPVVEFNTKNDDLNDESGGLYIITDLAHYLSNDASFTKLNLVRDSFGKK